MDVSSVLSDKPLLVKLSKEYELLKNSGEDVDFDQWIKFRLREAAAMKAVSPSNGQEAGTLVGMNLPQTRTVLGDMGNRQQEGRNESLKGVAVNQLGFTHNKQAEPFHTTYAVRPGVQEPSLDIAGEGRDENLLHGAYHAARRPLLAPPPGSRPERGRTGIGPLLKAETERERLLSLSAALARQQLAVGGENSSQMSAALKSDYLHVLELVKRLAQQNDDLSQQVKTTQQQLQQEMLRTQEQLLSQVKELEGVRPRRDGEGGQHAGVVKVTGHGSDIDHEPDRGPQNDMPLVRGARRTSPARDLPWFVRAAAEAGPISPRKATRVPPLWEGGRKRHVSPTPRREKEEARRLRKDRLKQSLRDMLGLPAIGSISSHEHIAQRHGDNDLQQLTALLRNLSQGSAASRRLDGDGRARGSHLDLRARANRQEEQSASGHGQGTRPQPLSRLEASHHGGEYLDTDPAVIRGYPRSQEALEEEVALTVLADSARTAKSDEDRKLKKLELMENQMSVLMTRVENMLNPDRLSNARDLRPDPLTAAPGKVSDRQSGQAIVDPHVTEGGAVGVVELQRMMMTLKRMEEKEEKIRHKWFPQPPETLEPRQASTAGPLAVRDGILGTSLVSGPAEVAIPGNAVVGDSERGVASGSSCSYQAHKPSEHAQVQKQSLPQRDVIDRDTLQQVLSTREDILRCQRIHDGELVVKGLPLLGAVEVVEDLTDLIIEELLHEHAKEMASLCDSMGDELFDGEFQDA
ncbi:hypothetical protein CEUSTIGMA_g10847.t1 [Chlamydomonas eustigma]|uniref:Uncharacterized protein n=1 Tax=Chlamydomonas eustigma TaxID=1157962 RepID=A0A250XKH0_9CHLO|nr:hypothetical protein CEUSTIGMA_g10847.t1 [Chlamydomonas eustigma]|eukprot:GAX83422.1 hypothetical protein CEUSTIGMA_g10847.t1 [Chlamydomonas eustigma]